MTRLKALVLGALVALAGCAETALPSYYLLPTPEVSGSAPYSGGTIAVREMELPLYARLLEFASLNEDGSVDVSDANRWADEPPRAATRALVSALKQLTGAPLVAEPWPATVTPAIRVDVAVDRFIGDLTGGTLELSGQYRIVRQGGGDGDQSSFTYRIPIAEPGYKALAAAHSRAIAKLAEEIALRIAAANS